VVENTLVGGLGNDIYVVDAATDTITENPNEGTDTILSSVTIAALAANVENLTLTGATAINGIGNVLDNVISGNSANNSLTGGAGNDWLRGGSGTDTLFGNDGSDTFAFSRGDGVDAISNLDASALTTDRVLFDNVGGAIAKTDLWFGRATNDLVISILGTTQTINLTNWYTDATAQLDQVVAGTGSVLNRSSVDQLVNAMAGFTTAAGIANATVTPAAIPTTVQTAINSAWVG
jgi:Ca2+-binding RTX toxin-like protein